MIEPPPVVEGYQPPPPPPKDMLLSAWSTTALLVAVIFIVSNILAVPFIFISIMNRGAKGDVYGPTATAKVFAKLAPDSASKVQDTLSRRLPGNTVSVTETGRELVVMVRSSTGHSNIVDLQKTLGQVLSAEGVKPIGRWNFTAPVRKPSLEEIMEDPMILLGSVLTLQATMLLVWLIGRKTFFKGENKLPPFHSGQVLKPILIGVIAGIAVAVFANVLDSTLTKAFHITEDSMWDAVLKYPPVAKIAVILTGVIGAPIIEEIFFRGMLIGLFQRANKPWLGVVVSSVLFGIAHLQNAAVVISITLMGLILGTVYVKTKSIYATMIIHFVNNAISFGLLLFATK